MAVMRQVAGTQRDGLESGAKLVDEILGNSWLVRAFMMKMIKARQEDVVLVI